MPVIRTKDDVELSYRASGDGPAALVLIHGWAGSGAYFQETIEHLSADGLRTIAVDLRGHGRSQKVTHGYDFDRLAEDVWSVVDEAGANRCVLVGFSMSGKLAQYMGTLRPEAVAGVIMVAGFPASVIPFPAETIRDWSARAGDRERLREVIMPFITRPVPPHVLDRYLADAAEVPAAALEQTLERCVNFSFTERTSRLTMPVLVVAGRHDQIFPPEAARATARSLPCARSVTVDANHEIPMEQPADLARMIEAFVAGLGLGCA